MNIADLYQSVTADIIKDLEAGTAPWTKPWKNGNTGASCR
jgi:antirestriction protein ArdC